MSSSWCGDEIRTHNVNAATEIGAASKVQLETGESNYEQEKERKKKAEWKDWTEFPMSLWKR